MTTKPNEPESLETVDIIREWLLSTDHPVSQWERDFAAAIDAHRAPAHPVADAGGVTDADREAAAKCVEHGLSRPNPLNVRQGVVDSWHLVQAFARHRLQSVAAATAGMPTIWEDPAGKGYPCFERPMTPAEAKDAIDRDGQMIVRLEDAINRAAMRFDLAAENGKERAETYRKWASEARAALSEAREAGAKD